MCLLQPPPEVFDLFDDVILMDAGQIVYQGPREQVRVCVCVCVCVCVFWGGRVGRKGKRGEEMGREEAERKE